MEFYPLGNSPLRSLFPSLSFSCCHSTKQDAEAEYLKSLTSDANLNLKEVQKRMREQQKLKNKIEMPKLQRDKLVAEDETLSKVMRYYGKEYSGTDPVADTISLYEDARKKEYNIKL